MIDVMEGPERHRESLPTASALGLSQFVHKHMVSSTMDVAHELAAAGAPSGLLVLADCQERGRGRGGHHWESAEGSGLWMTLLERPSDHSVIGVLALRLGLAIAEALEPFVDAPIGLKWPNDVMAGSGKIAGILVEARWRESLVEWVAIGIGINRRIPAGFPAAAAVRNGVSRATLLESVVPRLRVASALRGSLSASERAQWQVRDFALGKRICRPRPGIVTGISADGALMVADDTGSPASSVYAGSVEFDDREPS